jgi:hypothetical protein
MIVACPNRWHELKPNAMVGLAAMVDERGAVGESTSTATATNTSALFGISRWGWGFSMSQDFNGDIALIACFASSWTAAMVRRWHADPFGFLRPWNEVPSLMGSAPPATGTGVVVCIMG